MYIEPLTAAYEEHKMLAMKKKSEWLKYRERVMVEDLRMAQIEIEQAQAMSGKGAGRARRVAWEKYQQLQRTYLKFLNDWNKL